jgi:hypothetical protein
MSNIELQANDSSKNHALIIAGGLEVYFIYIEVVALIVSGIPDISTWLVFTLIKIGLAYWTFRLYISQKKKLAIIGSLLAVFVIGFSMVTSVVNFLYDLAPVIGGWVIFVLIANSLFLFHYLKNRESIKLRPTKWYIAMKIFILVGFIDAIAGFNDGVIHILLLCYWITFYLETEGVIRPKHSLFLK